MSDKPIDKQQQFLDNMVSFGLGEMLEELADAQTQVIEAVRDTLKTGSIVLTLKYKPNGKYNIDVNHQVKPTIPKAPGKVATMFQDEDNLLHEQDPQNKQLDFDNDSCRLLDKS